MSPRLPCLLPFARRLAVLPALAASAAFVSAQTVELSPLFVTASRGGEAAGYVPFSHVTIGGDELRESPNVTVDGTLRGIPGFSLFRRSDSLVANPSTQGVSLRGLGPSGASRSLVLLDGVPLNDAFGGWVLWSKVPRDSLASIEIVPGAGGSAWGNAALGGVIQLFTEPVSGSRERLSVRQGSYDTSDVEAQVTEPAGPGTFQLIGRYLTTDGYYVVAPEQRGPIDRPATSRARWLMGRWRQRVGRGVTATVTVRGFADDRGNGTPYQQNSSHEHFAALALTAQPSAGFQWNATAYAQALNFTSTFSSVNAARTAETPASNQFAVPATALGASWVGEWTGATGALTTAGVDTRDVRGETREDSAWVTDAFTHRRFAGGRQTTAGVFVLHSRPLRPDVRISAGLRMDGWRDADGHRRDYTGGVPAGETLYATHDGVEFSPSGGVVWQPASGVRLHASAQHAFRRPTLDELYRPFRVGNVITDANPNLRTEEVTTAEIGAAVQRGPFNAGVTGFWNDLRHAVTNVTIANGPVTLPGIGFVPAGGQARQKMNLDRSRVQGIALNAGWKITPALSLDAQYLYNDATVVAAAVAPWLVGRRLAEVPRHGATVSGTWKQGRWSVMARARWIGDQFDDDNNTLRLAPATLVDASIAVTLFRNAEVFVSAENIWDHRVETGRSPTGLVNIGTPRLILFGFRLKR